MDAQSLIDGQMAPVAMNEEGGRVAVQSAECKWPWTQASPLRHQRQAGILAHLQERGQLWMNVCIEQGETGTRERCPFREEVEKKGARVGTPWDMSTAWR